MMFMTPELFIDRYSANQPADDPWLNGSLGIEKLFWARAYNLTEAAELNVGVGYLRTMARDFIQAVTYDSPDYNFENPSWKLANFILTIYPKEK